MTEKYVRTTRLFLNSEILTSANSQPYSKRRTAAYRRNLNACNPMVCIILIESKNGNKTCSPEPLQVFVAMVVYPVTWLSSIRCIQGGIWRCLGWTRREKECFWWRLIFIGTEAVLAVSLWSRGHVITITLRFLASLIILFSLLPVTPSGYHQRAQSMLD